MRVLHRFTIAVACATALTMACGAKTEGGGGGGGTTVASACNDYFQAVTSSCPEDSPVNPTEPASQIQHVQTRWETLCAEVLGLPGSGVTPTALEACVSDLQKNGCAALNSPNGSCALGGPGTLPPGSSCASDEQCEQGACSAGTTSPDGGSVLCGSCVVPPAPGDSCATGQSCGSNATCFNNVCTAVTYVGVGAGCTAIATQCNAGLACNALGACAAPGGPDTPCEDSSECMYPLICTQASPGSESQACAAPAQVNGPCLDEGDCAAGLTCQLSTSRCATISFVGAGEACNEDTIQCLVGDCNTVDGNTGTCPTVIADGQACSENDPATTCDVLANCTGGVCVFGLPACP